MAKNFVKPGKNITLIAPTGGVTTGVGVLIGAIFAIALQTTTVGLAFEGATEGVWDIAKLNTEVWLAGDKIYWDNANARVTNAPTAAMRLIGFANEAAANPTTTGRVRLDGAAALFDDDAGPAPTSLATAGAETYTAAHLLSGIIVRDCAGASRTDTLATAALLVAAIPGVRVGDILRCLVINGSDPITEVITLAAGAGGAFDANQTAVSRIVAGGASKLVHIRFTNVTPAAEAYVVYA